MSDPRQATIPAVRCDCGKWAPAGQPCASCGAVNSGPYRGNDPASPVGAEAALQAFMQALDGAREALEATMNDEVDAELARDAAKRRWLLSDECQALRTVAERKAWAESKCEPEERAYRIAKARREAARAVLDVLGKQLSAQQSISRSVSSSYPVGGRDW